MEKDYLILKRASVALPLGPHPDWDTVRRSTDLTRLDIDFREMGELSAFVHMPTLPDPKNV